MISDLLFVCAYRVTRGKEGGEGDSRMIPGDRWEQWRRGLAIITTYRRGFEDWFAYVLRLVTQPRNAAHAPCLDCLSDSVARFSINNTYIYIRTCVRLYIG